MDKVDNHLNESKNFRFGKPQGYKNCNTNSVLLKN